MEDVTLEALRQAFLDRDARIRCDWDPRLIDYPSRDPNEIRHAWIERVELGGTLGNSTSALRVDFHPCLNVLIGGRGSGKSTVVAAVRQLYSGSAALPDPIRDEAEQFVAQVLPKAEIVGVHRIRTSREQQVATWTNQTGSLTDVQGSSVPTTYRVRVVNQKELFARVSQDPRDPFAVSRSLLAFLDESVGLQKSTPLPPGSWWHEFDQSATAWMSAARDHQKLLVDVSQMPSVDARIKELEGQVDAFDSAEAKERRARNDARLGERTTLQEGEAQVSRLISAARTLANEPVSKEGEATRDVPDVLARLYEISVEFQATISQAIQTAEGRLSEWRSVTATSPWTASVTAAEADHQAYLAELKAKGIDPDAYTQLRDQLDVTRKLQARLKVQEAQVEAMRGRRQAGWARLVELLDSRRASRQLVLDEVSAKNDRLRFELGRNRDATGWASSVRELLNLRADAFLEDVPALSAWLWSSEDNDERERRWSTWREGLAAADLGQLGAGLRSGWQKKIEALDETLRLRLAAEVPDDVLAMQFLRDGGDASQRADWQDVTSGSPGQRTAAMLAFVLHHGDEPLVLDQPEDDLDTEWISSLVVRELRLSRFHRQIIVISHNANIPVNGDAERVVVLENNNGALQVRTSIGDAGVEPAPHCGAIEKACVREDIQNIMEGGIRAFVLREKKYNNELKVALAEA